MSGGAESTQLGPHHCPWIPIAEVRLLVPCFGIGGLCGCRRPQRSERCARQPRTTCSTCRVPPCTSARGGSMAVQAPGGRHTGRRAGWRRTQPAAAAPAVAIKGAARSMCKEEVTAGGRGAPLQGGGCWAWCTGRTPCSEGARPEGGAGWGFGGRGRAQGCVPGWGVLGWWGNGTEVLG